MSNWLASVWDACAHLEIAEHVGGLLGRAERDDAGHRVE
jgi:hypothetical protein